MSLHCGDRIAPRRDPAEHPLVVPANAAIAVGSADDEAAALLSAARALRDDVDREGRATFARWRTAIRRRAFVPCALNLAHYLALRRRDLRSLQTRLMPWGLSSLGRSESRVLPTLNAVVATLAVLRAPQADAAPRPNRPPLRTFFRGERLLERNVRTLFGAAPSQRRVRVMVTLPTQAATDYELVRELLARGMDCARLNCAHDSVDHWSAIIENLRRAELETGRHCRVLMDLGGPRVRTAQTLQSHPHRRVFPGDLLLLRSDDPVAGEPWLFQARCEPAEVLEQLSVGTTVCIDEGKLQACVERQVPGGVLVRVLATPPKGGKLAAEKGLNFPGTLLRLASLTERDLQDLDFIAQYADLVGYSFVQEVADVERLNAELDARGCDARRPGVVIKVETARAIRTLPELIVAAAGRRPLGVMIARGDLAVEIGYERLAEMQEELLWLCEAAQVPVIWATQVLERLVKKGTPSRAEITDAAMSVRAECVMLNKGPFISAAVGILDDVLQRMQAHQLKKTPQLRALRSWSDVVD